MTKNMIRAALVAGCLMIGAALPAQAALLTWNLEDVTFTDGTTATGTITMDPTAHTSSTFNV